MTRLVRLVACSALLAFAVPAFAKTVEGVAMPDTATVGDQKLVLNGMGLRTKVFFKVYVGGLYVPEASKDSAKLLASDTARRQVMHFVREVGADKIVEAWREGFAANSPATAAALKPRIDAFCASWKDMKDGDEAVMTYVPGTGLSLTINGKAVGKTIEGKDFADAVLNNWVGPKPPTDDFKNGILGK